jgi:hypothetical protein
MTSITQRRVERQRVVKRATELGQISILKLRLLLNKLQIVKFQDTAFNSIVFIKKYKV